MLDWYDYQLDSEIATKVETLINILLCDRVYGLAKDNAKYISIYIINNTYIALVVSFSKKKNWNHVMCSDI
jgi:hypothetical protein